MWVFTDYGFFSVAKTHECDRDEVMVRARCREDVGRFADWVDVHFVKRLKIIRRVNADYLYRVKVSQVVWAAFIAQLAAVLDYQTVKDNISHSPLRTRAYFRVWREMVAWQVACQNARQEGQEAAK